MQIVSYEVDTVSECKPFNFGVTLFSYGCNLNCKMCKGYNYERVTNKKNIIGNSKDILHEVITPLHDCVVFIGGEPTIHASKLKESLMWCKDYGLKTKIFSNGMLTDVIESINKDKLCDSWSIDYKMACKDNYMEDVGIPYVEYVRNFSKSIMNIIDNNLPLEIRTTMYESNEKEREKVILLKKIFGSLDIFNKKCVYRNYIIQEDFRNYIA